MSDLPTVTTFRGIKISSSTLVRIIFPRRSRRLILCSLARSYLFVMSTFQLGKSEISKAGLVFMACFSFLDMSLQDSTLSREGSPEEEIMAAVVFSVGPLVSWGFLCF